MRNGLLSILLALATLGCISSRKMQGALSEPQRSYMQALAKERGITEDEARQIILKSRQEAAMPPQNSTDAARGAGMPANAHPHGRVPTAR